MYGWRLFLLGFLCGGAVVLIAMGGRSVSDAAAAGVASGLFGSSVANRSSDSEMKRGRQVAGWNNTSASSNADGDGEAAVQAVMRMDPRQVESALREQGIAPLVVDPAAANETGVPSDPSWKQELYARLNRILLVCGELCRMNSPSKIEAHYMPHFNQGGGEAGDDGGGGGTARAPLFPTVTAATKCPVLMASEDIDAGDTSVPSFPSELEPYYTLSGALGISPDKKRRDIYLGGESETSLWKTGSRWEEADIDECVASVAAGTLKGSYGVDEANEVRDQIVWDDPDRLRGKSVLVIGSSHPWIECICLHHGAAMVTTLEYGTIESKHPRIQTETPDTFRAKYISGALKEFDGVVTHSSLEHSGLGRYGDALNPWGDILALARAWCVTKPGGFLWLGLPVGRDMLLSNWHRVYGKIRLPLLATNWRQIGGRSTEEEEEIFQRGKWKSMKNTGHLFEKIAPQ